ncbi:SDR family oxidoreductase [Lysinibacillus agricola]|uniref:SDR family oxidoreductase n=1 Tax=Lysinibacillus agricola TaxID=2590012 RepID=A0ABX7ALQ5_9BACI|nr:MULTISPECIES: SDR family NAD(P)-dependent oxidoreductase [Lysinibacillus]KOS59826.1 oxidoreductase [Lysinibacillus sp. FJAT-14222]QQP10604.1 SDR family oxidoreductase [Lysinibacillus agricola]
MKKLEGKVAVVTGAARGIGRSYALRLAQLGAHVGIIDVDLKSYQHFEKEHIGEQYETVVDELLEHDVKAIGVEADVSNEAAVQAAFNKIVTHLGEVDILVANAGGGTGAILENKASEIDLEQLKIVYERNFVGTVNCVKAVAGGMKKKNYGKIVTVSSVTGLQATEGGTYSHYGSTKAAIVSYTKYLAQDLGPYNITVNAIAPGYIATGRLIEQFEKAGAETYTNQTALKRFGTPEDCANVIEFLTTDLSDYVTGSVIDVTGGITK